MAFLKKINELSLQFLTLAGVLAVASLAVDVVSAAVMYFMERTGKHNDDNPTA